MKQQALAKLFKLTLILFIIFLFASFGYAARKLDNLVIATFESPFPPMVWYEEKNSKIEAIGAEPDILRELAKRSNINYELILMPWPRIKDNIRSGEIDASLGGWKLPERETYGIYMAKPMLYDYFELSVLKGNEFKFEAVEDLFDKNIGKIHGVNVYPALDQAVKDGKIKVIEVATRESLINMLLSRRLDAMLTSTVVTGFELKKLGIKNVVALPKILTKPQGTYIWFSKKANIDPIVIKKFNKSMRSMHLDGTINKILLKYGINQNFYHD